MGGVGGEVGGGADGGQEAEDGGQADGAAALLARLAQMEGEKGAEFVSIFYGEDVTEEQAQQAQEIFSTACPDAEVSLLPGGQPVYYYMISVE